MSSFNEEANIYRKYLKSKLASARDASGCTELVVRCMYCPDSKDIRHGHMYIEIPQSPNRPSRYYCQKCKSSGLVTPNKLLEWGIYDTDIATWLLKINKISNSSTNINYKYNQFNRQVSKIQNIVFNNTLAYNKLNYINSRLGINLTIDECIQNKIVLNLIDLLKYNNINNFTRHPNIIQDLNKYFIGFLSFDNAFINMRRICDEGIVYCDIDKRYINYNIFNKLDNTEKFYVLPNTFNLNSPDRVKIHIAEGPFDILSVKYNLCVNNNDNNHVYVAISGPTYKSTLKYVINTMMLYYSEIHLYPDNDDIGNEGMIQSIIKYLTPYRMPLYIHRNGYPGEKDFGVIQDHIIDYVEKRL